jgi:hypothetical protein
MKTSAVHFVLAFLLAAVAAAEPATPNPGLH